VGCILPELETFIFPFLALKKKKKENLFSLLSYKMKPKFVNGLSFSISKSPILQPFRNEKSSLSIYSYRHCTHFLLAWEARNLWAPQDTRYKTTCIHASHSLTPLATENNNLLLHLSLALSLSQIPKNGNHC